MYKGLRFAVLSRILDSGGAVKGPSINRIVAVQSCSGKQTTNNKVEETRLKPFSEFIETRLSEASRSFLIEIDEDRNISQLFTICEKYGKLEKVFKCDIGDGKKMILLEMKEKHHKALSDHITFTGPNGFPGVYSPFIAADFNSIIAMDTKFKHDDILEIYTKSSGESDSNILWSLYNNGTICDFDTRLRFLVVAQMNSILRGLWRNAKVIPFGGSVNGFGSRFSDLDMTVTFEKPEKIGFIHYRSRTDNGKYKNECFNVMSTVLRAVVPGCKCITPIPTARVPIVKFFHNFVKLECDLSINSSDGVLSTELMYYMAHLHGLVRPLAFIIKTWAKDLKLVVAYPSKTLTNFGLLSMIIFFLQQKDSLAVPLPPFAELVSDEMSEPFSLKRFRIIEGIKSRQTDSHKQDLDKLLYKFFDYYSRFNFRNSGICLRTGKTVTNKNVPLLIVNPFKKHLNITQQVTEKEIQKLKHCFVFAKQQYEVERRYTSQLFNSSLYPLDDIVIRKANKRAARVELRE